jgi:hypothetical protein
MSRWLRRWNRGGSQIPADLAPVLSLKIPPTNVRYGLFASFRSPAGPLPVYLDQRTSSDRPGMSQRCQIRKCDGVGGRDLLQVAEPSQVGVFKCDFFGPPRSRSALGYA